MDYVIENRFKSEDELLRQETIQQIAEELIKAQIQECERN